MIARSDTVNVAGEWGERGMEHELWFECQMVGVRFWTSLVSGTFEECYRAVRPGGSWYIVRSGGYRSVVMARSVWGGNVYHPEAAPPEVVDTLQRRI